MISDYKILPFTWPKSPVMDGIYMLPSYDRGDVCRYDECAAVRYAFRPIAESVPFISGYKLLHQFACCLYDDRDVVFANICKNQMTGVMFVASKSRDCDEFYLMGLYVLPGFQRMGIGPALMENMAAYAGDVGKKRIWGQLLSKDPTRGDEYSAALGEFYIKHGFTYIGTSRLLIERQI